MIGLRRKFAPPLLDTYQDMIFVMYGKRDIEFKFQPYFMKSLENVVDSISPASAAWQTRKKKQMNLLSLNQAFLNRSNNSNNNNNNDGSSSLRNELSHSLRREHLQQTYYDLELLQIRANTFSLNREMYSWLKNRPGMVVVIIIVFVLILLFRFLIFSFGFFHFDFFIWIC